MSITWWNWVRSSPFALMRLGSDHHRVTRAAKWLATCLVHCRGTPDRHAHRRGRAARLRAANLVVRLKWPQSGCTRPGWQPR